MTRPHGIAGVVRLLVDPGVALSVAPSAWPGIISAARAEALLGTIAARVLALPGAERLPVAAILQDARDAADHARRAAVWEARMAAAALDAANVRFVLLKGTAYAALDHPAAVGRQIGDLDILVAHRDLAATETALAAAGWEPLKQDAYDDAYYRQWMHELPPLIHRERDRMIDVHHTILPLTHRAKPDADAMLARAQRLDNGLWVLDPLDRIVHCAAHLLADGDLTGGLRNLWDFHLLVETERALHEADLRAALLARSSQHGLRATVERALRLRDTVFGSGAAEQTLTDRLFVARLLARDDWGRGRRPATRAAFYVRSHLLRMPLRLLIPHLWRKARRRSSAGGSL